jgi:hypothetical protein
MSVTSDHTVLAGAWIWVSTSVDGRSAGNITITGSADHPDGLTLRDRYCRLIPTAQDPDPLCQLPSGGPHTFP